MAYYCAVYKGKRYVNRALLKAVFQVGDAGIMGLVATGDVKVIKLLDQQVYEANLTFFAWHDLPVKKQDIDEQLSRLKYTYRVPDRIKFPKLDKFTFMPLSVACHMDKYRWVKKQPHIILFGRKYVALNAVIAS